ncbi:MAG: hypothetical protein ACRCU3_02705 [Eubacteriaceae bacterium]
MFSKKIRININFYLTFLLFLLMLFTLQVSPLVKASSGLEINLLKSLEGHKVRIVDESGEVLETVTIDAMGKAKFKENISEGASVEMDIDAPLTMRQLNEKNVYGMEYSYVITIVLLLCVLEAVMFHFYYKKKIRNEYGFLMEYALNEELDGDE